MDTEYHWHRSRAYHREFGSTNRTDSRPDGHRGNSAELFLDKTRNHQDIQPSTLLQPTRFSRVPTYSTLIVLDLQFGNTFHRKACNYPKPPSLTDCQPHIPAYIRSLWPGIACLSLGRSYESRLNTSDALSENISSIKLPIPQVTREREK